MLICDDDLDMANLIASILRVEGIASAFARDTEEAKAMLAARTYDAMILDLVLPGQSGESLLYELRTNGSTPELPVVVVSGNVAKMDAQIGGDLGVLDRIPKPID